MIPLFVELLDIQGVKMSINYGMEKVRFPSPVPVDSRIRLRAEVISVEDVSGNGVQMDMNFTIEVEGSTKPACVAHVIYRHYA